MKSALLLYPHQLYDVTLLPDSQTIIMVEEPLFFGTDQEHPFRFHKQKLILHRASMRRYVEEVLWPAKKDVEYIDLDVLYTSGDILERAKQFDQLLVIDPVHETLTRRLLEARRDQSHVPELQFLPSPNFYLKDQEVRQYFHADHDHPFEEFYQWQRERFNILIGEDYKPEGGQLMFDTLKPGPLPPEIQLPSFEAFGSNKFVQEATQFVMSRFSDNPGTTDFIWPTNHAEAKDWLEDFTRNRLAYFATYAETIDSKANWQYHSALSASLNIGLLSPSQVVTTVLKEARAQELPTAAVEPFIRQIIGQREFMRGLYISQHPKLLTSNPFKHERKLTSAWYNGETGIQPFDDMVHKVRNHAYAHQVERLMIAGNLMTLAEVQPAEIRRWFSELFIDTQDWALLPNVYGLSQFGERSAPATPHISPSSFILKMSHYDHGVWSDVWDGLFWRFIERHREHIKHNPAMRTMIQRLDKLDPDHKRVIGYRAEDFLNRCTLL